MNDSTIYGVCGEGTSMHNLELISDDGDTLSVFIDDENPDVVQGGLLAGDRIALIGYKAEDGEMMAQKIINLTSLLGKWTSLDKNFDILEGGEVKNNVKAETNPWTSWKILNGKLLLNKDTFAIDKLGSDSLMLENTQGIFVFKRQVVYVIMYESVSLRFRFWNHLKYIYWGVAVLCPHLSIMPRLRFVEMRGKCFMVDCGEGAQMQFRRSHVHFAKMNAIFISHHPW